MQADDESLYRPVVTKSAAPLSPSATHRCHCLLQHEQATTDKPDNKGYRADHQEQAAILLVEFLQLCPVTSASGHGDTPPMLFLKSHALSLL